MFQYKLGFIPTNFVIIGAGGTGGRLVPLLAQFLKTITWIQNQKIYVVDYDMVEEKNLARQNFIRLDIGKPKAVVLADRYGRAFDLNIIPIVKEVKIGSFSLSETSHADLGVIKVTLETINNAIVIMCVDSAEARRRILTNLHSGANNKNICIIDAGNENDFGQVQVFNNGYVVSGWSDTDIKQITIPGLGIPFNVDVPVIPFPAEFYEGLKDADNKSCAELDQTLAINAMMATSIMGILQNLIYLKPISFHKLNVSLSYGNIPELMTLEYLHGKCMDIHKGGKAIRFPQYATSLDSMISLINQKMMKEFNRDITKVKASKAKAKKKTEIEIINEEIDAL